MERILLNEDWKFSVAEIDKYFWIQTPEQKVDIPHDYSVTVARDKEAKGKANNAFCVDGAYDYVKKIYAPKEWEGKKLLLEFEGVYMNASVFCNGNFITRHPYGYTEFHCDITKYIKYESENEIKVTVISNQPNTRWYSGLGIYRPVWLLIGNDVMIRPWGTYITTCKNREIQVSTEVENNSSEEKSIIIRHTVLDADGNKVLKSDTNYTCSASSCETITVCMENENLELWSLDNPYLYTMQTEILCGDVVIDESKTKFGVRDISFDAQNGFMLNGKTVKLKGGCVHHDCGILGAVSYIGAERRKVRLHRENGYNAIRTAHNPPSKAFLDACDEMGILVIDEIFDCWNVSKTTNDYGMFFEKYWKDDVTSMVKRDRNHPSIIMWSTGNEIPERDGSSDGYNTAAMLADYIRSLDDTRAVTNAVCILYDPEAQEHFAEITEKFIEPLDVAGYNYMPDRYENDAKLFPERVFYGSEAFANDIFNIWEKVEKFPYVIGDFVWTSLDYLGEAGIGRVKYSKDDIGFVGKYPWRYAWCGDIDVCGNKRPQSYYRDCVWDNEMKPYIGVHDPEKDYENEDASMWSFADLISSWTFAGYEGKTVHIEVFSCADEIELIINGVSLGKKKAGYEMQYKVMYEAEYQPGTIEAVAYKDGAQISRSKICTAGQCVGLRTDVSKSDCAELNGTVLAYVMIEAVDEKGNVCTQSEEKIKFNAENGVRLLALGNSDPLSEEIYTQSECYLYRGRALAIVELTDVDNIDFNIELSSFTFLH